MIYIRQFEDNKAVLDYDGTNKDLRLEMLLTIDSMFKSKDLEQSDLGLMILDIFKKLDDINKLTLISMMVEDAKGGKLWQELEGLNKKEKK